MEIFPHSRKYMFGSLHTHTHTQPINTADKTRQCIQRFEFITDVNVYDFKLMVMFITEHKLTQCI